VRYSSSGNDDLISGTHRGLQFELLETRLEWGSGANAERVFHGLIFRFRLEAPFPGTLAAAKRGGWVERTWKEMWRTSARDELLSGNRRLDETHLFHSDNPDAARPLIAGPLTSPLIALGEWRTNDIRIALWNDTGYLMLPAEGNYFRLPP